MTEDLFGAPDPPRKGGPDYLAWLNNLELPDGLKFLQLSTERLAPGVPKQYVDVIIAVDPRDPEQRWHQLVIDLRTGQKYVGEPTKLNSSIHSYLSVYRPVTSEEILGEEGPER